MDLELDLPLLETISMRDELFAVFQDSADIDILESVIGLTEDVASQLPPDHPYGHQCTTDLLIYWDVKFQSTQVLTDLHQVILHAEDLLEATPHDHPNRPARLGHLSYSLYTRYQRTQYMHDLNQAILYSQQALATRPLYTDERTAILKSAYKLFHLRFTRTARLADLHGMVVRARDLMQVTGSQGHIWSHLSAALGGGNQDRERAIIAAKRALAGMRRTDPARGSVLSTLSTSYYLKYQQTEGMDEIRMAISYATKAVAEIHPDHPDHVTAVENLSTLLDWRVRLDAAMHDLGIIMDESVLSAQPESIKCLGDLAIKLYWRHEQTDDATDKARAAMYESDALGLLLEQDRAGFLAGLQDGLDLRCQAAVSYARVVLEFLPDAHPDRGPVLADLADTLFNRYWETDNMERLQLAISCIQEACAHAGTDRIHHINNLSTLWFKRYQHTHVLEDLLKGIRCCAKALANIPRDHRLRLVMMNNQAARLRLKFDETQHIDDLQQAIALMKAVLADTPPHDSARADVLISMSDFMALKYHLTQDADDMRQVVPYAKEALAATPEGHPDRAHRLNGLATKFYWRYKQTALLGDIRQAQFLDEQALRATELQEGAPSRALYLSNLAAMRHASYQRSASLDDITEAISLAKEALVTNASPGDPVTSRYLVQLARYFEHRYNHVGDVDDVRQCVRYGEEALVELPEDHPARVHLLAILSRGRSVLYKEAGAVSSSGIAGESMDQVSPPDSAFIGIPAVQLDSETPAPSRTTAIEHLQHAISYSNEALEATPHDHPDRSARMQLAESLKSQYEQTVTNPDLNHALFRDEQALAAAPPPSPDRHRLLGNLIRSVLLLPNGSEFDIPADRLSRYIAHVEEWADGSYDRSAPLACLFFRRYLQTQCGDDLEQAIGYNGEVLAGMGPQGRQRRRVCLILQALLMLHRYQDKRDIDDLERAISYGEQNLTFLVPHDDQTPGERQWVDHYGFLADCFWARFGHTGDMADIDREILYREQSLASVPPERTLAVKARLRELSLRLKFRYEQTQQMADLNRAIRCGQEGYEPPSVDGASNLYILLMRRFERSGDTTDLEQCITYATSALDAAPLDADDDYTRAGCLTNLAGGLQHRYVQYSELKDLTRAIALSEESLAAVPDDHKNRAGLLQNIVGLLGLLYNETEDTGDLDKAMWYGELGLAAAKDLRERAGILLNLGDILHSRFMSTADVDSLQQAISYADEALAAFPADHPARGMAFLDLGQRYMNRAQHSDSPDDLDRSVVAFKEAWAYPYLMPSERVRAARGAAAALINRPGGAMEAYSLLEGAVLLLPEVSPRSLAGDELMSTMSGMHGLAADVASAALEAGVAAAGALELLELSRGVMASISIDCRSDLSDLSMTDQGLFNQFNNLRVEIDTPLPEWMYVNYRVPMVDAIRRRREGVDKMADLIAEIRNLPGHEGFQLPLSPAKLMSMADGGAIVTFSSSSLRSDAIIVTSSSITSIPLPKLSFTELGTRLGGGAIAKLSSGTFRTYGARNNKLRDLLLWLWNVAVRPVIQELKLTATAGSDAADLPHICWIGTGLLGVAPFHAAGDYARNADPLQNTMSYVVSSYTPTIKALSYAREKELTILGRGTDSRSRMLLVTMPVTPGEADLPDVDREVENILEVTKGSITSTHLAKPSADEVLREFESFAAMHLACHGISDASTPSRSHLILLAANGTADCLNIRRISRRNTATSAQVVYLSACSTAESTGVQFADESLHIASGFQLAGFSHVLAAMWSAESKVCVAVSTEFYRALFDGRGEGHRKVRVAFHEAVKKVQEQYRRSPLKWAPFIHMGA